MTDNPRQALYKAQYTAVIANKTDENKNEIVTVVSNNYNSIGKPAVIMVKDGIDRAIVKRQSYEQIVCNDL